MRSHVELVADAGADGRTRLVRMRAEGQLAARATGPARVHLVGTAAGPLGGDLVEIVVRVLAGARLEVHGVAASLALPGRAEAPGRMVTTLEVADGGRLTFVPPPLVVCRGARLHTLTTVTLTGSGTADVAEQVVLGRHGEPGGDWTGRLVAQRGGLPLLRTTQTSALLGTATVPPGDGPVRAVVTRLLTASDTAPAAPVTSGGAVRCALAAGGVLVTALGATLGDALADVDAVLAGSPGSVGALNRLL